MLVSSSSMKVARVTVIATSQGFTAGLATVSAAVVPSGLDKACVLTDQLPCIRRKPALLRDAYAVYNDAKKYNLFELPGCHSDGLVLHALGIFPGIALAGCDEQAGQTVHDYAKDLCRHFHVEFKALLRRAFTDARAQAVHGSLADGDLSLGNGPWGHNG